MNMLEFARGPALTASLAIFVAGTVWRLWCLWRRPAQKDFSAPRAGTPGAARAAFDGVISGLWPRRAFGQTAMVTTFNGYVFHLGLALVVFGYAPHIAFIHRLTGLAWPALPDAVMYLAAALTLLSLALAMWLRLGEAVLKQISNADDYLSWTLTMLPLVTGMAVVSEPSVLSAAHAQPLYGGPLAIHLMSLELLLLWFPFGKLMHAVLFVFSRGATGIRLRHRGVQV